MFTSKVLGAMALEWRDTRAEPHQLGKAMVMADSHDIKRESRLSQHALTIPAPELFRFHHEQPLSNSPAFYMPQACECAIHLELLEVFYLLRQRILNSGPIDVAMGIRPDQKTKIDKKGPPKILRDKTPSIRQEDKWLKFVEFAVARFIQWEEELDLLLDNKDVISDASLPPIDVLMVWHSLLLNPSLFKYYFHGTQLDSMKFPWAIIHTRINNQNWSFYQGDTAIQRYEEVSGLRCNLFDQFENWATGSRESSPSYHLLTDFSFGSHISTDTISRNSPTLQYSTLFKSCKVRPAIQLRDAVIRQVSFIDKMNTHLWIRSPALEGTLRRAIDRYRKFCQLLKSSRSTILVPTLDIDLVWHTHQCAARYYGEGMQALVGEFVDHDDKIAGSDLDGAYEMTKELFRTRFGMEYQNCGCWGCEALLSEVEQMVDRSESNMDMAGIADRVKEQVSLYRDIEVERRSKELN